MRRATPDDLPAIRAALGAMLVSSPAPQMRFANLEVAMNHIEEAMGIGAGRTWVMGKYFILVDYGSDWYTNARFLIEQIILKIECDDDPVPLDTVIRNGLGYLRSHHSCAAIAAGDTQVGYMAPKYIAAGYQPLGTQFLKG